MEFAYNNNYHSSIEMAPYEALYGRKCRSPLSWDEIGKRELTGPEIIQDAAEKVSLIKQRLETAASRQKSYTDPKRRDVEFQVCDYVFLKVSPMKDVRRFGKKGNWHRGTLDLLRDLRELAWLYIGWLCLRIYPKCIQCSISRC